jgi:hypothetical protein
MMADKLMKFQVRGGQTIRVTEGEGDEAKRVFKRGGDDVELTREQAAAFADKLENKGKPIGTPVNRLSDGSTHAAEALPSKSHEAPASQPDTTNTSGEPYSTGPTTEAQGHDPEEGKKHVKTTMAGDNPTQTTTTQPKGDNLTGKGAGVVADDAAGVTGTTVPAAADSPAGGGAKKG